MFERQNDVRAIKLLKASTYCTRMERGVKLISIILSLSICVAGVLNHYLSFVDPMVIVCIAGVILVMDALLMALARRYQVWSASLMDIYDHYVYNIPSNKLVTKYMSPVVTDYYARKVKDKKEKLHNYYFNAKENCETHAPVFENQYKQFVAEYNLLCFARIPLYIMWIGFFVGILAISATFNDRFFSTIVNIFVPSLGVIMLIINAWINFEENLRDLRHCTANLDKKIFEYKETEGSANLNSAMFQRSVQDAIYKFRSTDFTVPSFLYGFYCLNEGLYYRRMAKQGIAPEPMVLKRKKKNKNKTQQNQKVVINNVRSVTKPAPKKETEIKKQIKPTAKKETVKKQPVKKEAVKPTVKPKTQTKNSKTKK